MKKLLNNLFIKPILRFPYWFYLFCRKYIPGYKRLPHILQEIIAFILVIQTLLVGTGLVYLFGPWTEKNSVEAAWFNESWGYRKTITLTVTSSASDITNLDTLLTVDTTGITDKLQSNCEDLRFTDANGTILSHFLDSCNDNSATNKVWVRANLVPKNTTTYTMHMYYGNPSAANASNSTLFSLYNGLEGYWAMNEASWNTTPSEVKNNGVSGVNGTAVGNATTTSSGQFDRGGSFDGTGDYFTVADNAGLEIGANDFTIASWVYITSYPNSGFGTAIYQKNAGGAVFSPVDIVVRSTSADAEHDIHVWMSTTGSSWNVLNDQDVGGGSALSLNAWHHVAFIRESGVCKLYIDTVVTSATSSGVSCAGTLLDSSNAHLFNGQFQSPAGAGGFARMDDARIYTRALGATDLSNLYSNPGNIATNANATVVPSTVFASEEKAPSPVAYWKFDDGQGTNNQDSSSNNFDGTMTNFSSPATPTSGWQTDDQCVAGKCLSFDKADDVVTAGSPAVLDDMSAMTISAWIYPRTIGENAGASIIMTKAVGTSPTSGWQFRTANPSGNTIGFAFIVDGSTDLERFTDATVMSGRVQLNQWSHVAVSWSGNIADATTIKFYINGKLADNSGPVNGSSRVSDASSTLHIGNDSTGAWTFDGKIDEPKIYNYVRSAAQIQADYNARSNPEGLSTELGVNTQNLPAVLSSGLVGYWKLDESSGNVADSSGNGQTLTNTNTATFTIGKFGNSANLVSASTQYFTCTDANCGGTTELDMGTRDWTTSAWVKTSATSGVIMSKCDFTGGSNPDCWMMLIRASGRLEFILRGANTDVISTDDGSTFNDGNWHHVATVISRTGTIDRYIDGVQSGTRDSIATSVVAGDDIDNANAFRIGARDVSGNEIPFNGQIDEARVYNRALSGAEVSQLYNWAPGPVGYWRLDEGSGANAVDSSGYANNGSITVGTGGYINGKYSKGYNFDSANSIIDAGSGSSLDNLGPLTFEAWVYPRTCGENFSGSDRAGFMAAKNTNASQNNGGWLFLCLTSGGPTNSLQFTVDGTTDLDHVTSDNTLTMNTWQHVALSWDGVMGTASSARIYVNGREASYQRTTNGASRPSDAAANFYIGNAATQTGTFDGFMDEVKLYNYTRTPAQIIEDMNGGHPAPGSPVSSAVAHWKLDEGYGTTANDSTPNDNDLTLSTATSAWTNSAKFGKGWNGTGSNWLSRADDPDLDFAAADDGTISLWFKSDSASNPGANEFILAKGTSTVSQPGYAVYASTSGTICFGIDDDSSGFAEDTTCSTSDFYDGNWHHLAIRKTSNTRIDLYIDGNPEGTPDTNISATGSLENTGTFYIGDQTGSDNGNEFNGDIDEIKVYRSALTADQVKIDMNRSQAERLGNTGNNSNFQTGADAQKYCIPGDTSTCTAPVSEWNFEERTGSTVNDTGGSGNTGTWQGTLGNQWYLKGKIATAGNFNGSDNYVSVTDNGGLNPTVLTEEAWVYPKVNGVWASIINRRRVNNDGGWTMEQNASTNSLQCQYQINGTGRSAQGTTALTLNAWNHVACTYDGSQLKAYVNGRHEGTFNAAGSVTYTGTLSVQIGRNAVDGSLFTGYIDQVRVFNYARTATQIYHSYSMGKPLGHWKLDECQGTTINDSSGKNLTGTLTIGGTGSNTSVGTCTSSGAWFDGATGKRNAAMDFDGTDDYITITTPTILQKQDFTYSAWVKRGATGTNQAIFVYTNTTSSGGTAFYFDTNNKLALAKTGQSACASNTAVTDTTNWHFVAVTYDTTNCRFYLDGVPDGTPAYSQTFTYSGDARIGATTSSNSLFTGLIDDVKFHTTVLTDYQIKTLYNEGAYRVGPTTGSP